MKKIWSHKDGGRRNGITSRRKNMKKLMALGIATGLAVAAFLGTTMLSTSGAVESTAGSTNEIRSEPIARNLVDFQNGVYAGEMLKVSDIAQPTASTARNAVDWNNGLYAGELP